MAIPVRAALLWRALSLAEHGDVLAKPPGAVRAASERRRHATRLPGAWLVVGRRDPGVSVRDTTAMLADGSSVPVRIYRPRESAAGAALIVNFHGGGFVAGDPQQSEWWCSRVAAQLGAVVVSVDYRLAPEHPYPAAPEDCYGATVWAAEHATDLGADAARLAVMGDSAGGNLAAVVSLLARERGSPAIALQVLLYPVVEFVEQFASESENAHVPVLAKKDMDGASRLYFSGPAAGRQGEPYASVLRAEHAGLPPALIQTAQHDPLRDQGAAYAAALRAAGVPVRLTNYVDAVHGYISLPGVVPVARQALAEAVEALREALGTRDFPGIRARE